MTEVIVAGQLPEPPRGCICIPPAVNAAQKATELQRTTNGYGAGSTLPWEAQLILSVCGVIISRSLTERKLYESMSESTHRQCPVHDAIFWPRVGEAPQGSA